MPTSSTLRIPSSLVAWALLATVLALTVASTSVLYLSNRAGERAHRASQVADSYREFEVALLRAEVARHDLLLEGGSPIDLMYILGGVKQKWHVVERLEGDRKDAHVEELGLVLTGYRAAVDRAANGIRRDRPVLGAETWTDTAAARLVGHARRQTEQHEKHAAAALARMRALQHGAARTFPVAGALALALVSLCMRLLAVQSRRLANLREDAHHRSVTDELTGLANRAGLRLALKDCLEDSSPAPLAVMLLDLNNFKTVNDTYGHELGDDVLKAVAARLLKAAPAQSLVARLGGDEFVVVLHGADRVRAEEAATAFHAALSVPTLVQGITADVGASIGVALSDGGAWPADVTASDLLRRADIAMYRSKTSKAGPVLWSDNLDQLVASSPQRKTTPERRWRPAAG